LVTKLDIQTHPQFFRLIFQGDSAQCPDLEVNRAEMHRLLSVLYNLAQLADWGIGDDAGWLIEAETSPAAAGPASS
jgi:hypothetical protein